MQQFDAKRPHLHGSNFCPGKGQELGWLQSRQAGNELDQNVGWKNPEEYVNL
jgi:hypothetical protein